MTREENDTASRDALKDIFPRSIQVRINGKVADLLPFTLEDLDGVSEIIGAISKELGGKEHIRPDELARIFLSNRMAHRMMKFLLLRPRSDESGKTIPVNSHLADSDLVRADIVEAVEIVERAVNEMGLSTLVGKVVAGMGRFRQFVDNPDPSPTASNGQSSPTR